MPHAALAGYVTLIDASSPVKAPGPGTIPSRRFVTSGELRSTDLISSFQPSRIRAGACPRLPQLADTCFLVEELSEPCSRLSTCHTSPYQRLDKVDYAVAQDLHADAEQQKGCQSRDRARAGPAHQGDQPVRRTVGNPDDQ